MRLALLLLAACNQVYGLDGPTIPFATDPFFTPDCSRLYFSALDSVYSAPAY